MEKQTAVEYLFEQLWEEPKDKFTWHTILKKAKEMEGSIDEEKFNDQYEEFFDKLVETCSQSNDDDEKIKLFRMSFEINYESGARRVIEKIKYKKK